MNWKTYKTFGLVLFGLLGSLRSEAQKDTLFLTLDQLFELGVRQSLQLQADTLHEAVALEREKVPAPNNGPISKWDCGAALSDSPSCSGKD